MLKEFQEIHIVEGDLRQVPTEDGLGYYPDLQIIAISDGVTYIHPQLFIADVDALYAAENLYDRIINRETIDTDIWTQIEDSEFRYSDGTDDYYDSEEAYYMGVKGGI